jgi:N-succinyl-L-ornithine transcarbamylase
MKHFISVSDVPDINALVEMAIAFKQDPQKDRDLGKYKRVGLLFMNPSMRTRISTQIAAANLGMEYVVFNLENEGWKLELEDGVIMNGTSVEHIREAAPVLGQYFDILCVRSFPALKNRVEDYEEIFINQLKTHSGIPVVSMESATLHPLQSLADIMTIREMAEKTRRPKVALTWAPHIKPLPQCVPNSFAQWMNAWGDAEFVIAHPPGFELANEFSGNGYVINDQQEAIRDADFIYVKNWSAYHNYGFTTNEYPDWMLTPEKLKENSAKLMHCLPVRRNVEISEAVLDGANSIITKQAGNRVWAAQAVFASILKSKEWSN